MALPEKKGKGFDLSAFVYELGGIGGLMERAISAS
jgi:hypothetical protein